MTFDKAVEKMAQQYDGYRFAPESKGMFNPFSVLNALNFGDFDNYWFQTGTPTYLVNLLRNSSDYDLRLLAEGVELKSSSFMEYRADVKNPIPMIYQSGYLTIEDYDEKGYLIPYQLDGRKLIKAGVDFSKEKRNINHFVFR